MYLCLFHKNTNLGVGPHNAYGFLFNSGRSIFFNLVVIRND